MVKIEIYDTNNPKNSIFMDKEFPSVYDAAKFLKQERGVEEQINFPLDNTRFYLYTEINAPHIQYVIVDGEASYCPKHKPDLASAELRERAISGLRGYFTKPRINFRSMI